MKHHDYLKVAGNKKIKGEANINGFKHSAIPIIAASLITNTQVSLHDVPMIKDTFALTKIMEQSYGSRIRRSGSSLVIDNSNLDMNDFLDYDLASMVHGSAYLIPSSAIRFGRTRLYLPSGCRIGNGPENKRSIEHMIDVMKKFGAEIRGSDIYLESPEAAEIDISDYKEFRSSGATKTGIICGSAIEGTTKLRNCYMAQEVIDLMEFMKACGVKISYNNHSISIMGRKDFKEADFKLSKDLIELMTLISASAVTKSEIKIKVNLDCIKHGLESELWQLGEMGFGFDPSEDSFMVKPPEKIKPIHAVFEPYPGAYSDNQPLFASMLLHADGESTIEDRVWYSRFCYKEGLQKLGAKISQDKNRISILPPKEFVVDQTLEAPDCRAAAAYLVAALGVKGETKITNYHHLERGYQDIVEKLNSLGSNITEVLT